MHREWKIAKDQPNAWTILFYQGIEKRGEILTGRALEIAEFFQGNHGVGVAADVNRFCHVPFGDSFLRGDIQARRLHCLREQRAAAHEHGQRVRTNNDERQTTLHKNDSCECGTEASAYSQVRQTY